MNLQIKINIVFLEKYFKNHSYSIVFMQTSFAGSSPLTLQKGHIVLVG